MNGMIKLRRFSLLGLTFAALSLFSACKQGPGERCQIDSDCDDNYYCLLNGSNRAEGGTCVSSLPMLTDLSMPSTPDMHKPGDMTALQPDMSMPGDM